MMFTGKALTHFPKSLIMTGMVKKLFIMDIAFIRSMVTIPVMGMMFFYILAKQNRALWPE
ncbi:hypothetical protein DP804_23210 [Salmonella enterica subsp. enterica]|nr:hypothetical protein [Salmonella enterica subsp. enterica serovar Virchow]